MQRTHRDRKIFLVLSANAIVLVAILMVLVSRDNRLSLAAPAFGQAQQQQPIAGGSGLFVMPAQLAPNTWGCYLLDTENKTLCVYQYSPGEKLLRFAAARDVQHDRLLGDFNTLPPPTEVKDLVKREREGLQTTQPLEK